MVEGAVGISNYYQASPSQTKLNPTTSLCSAPFILILLSNGPNLTDLNFQLNSRNGESNFLNSNVVIYFLYNSSLFGKKRRQKILSLNLNLDFLASLGCASAAGFV